MTGLEKRAEGAGFTTSGRMGRGVLIGGGVCKDWLRARAIPSYDAAGDHEGVVFRCRARPKRTNQWTL